MSGVLPSWLPYDLKQSNGMLFRMSLCTKCGYLFHVPIEHNCQRRSVMGLTTDPNDPGIRVTKSDGQHEVYLVLSEEERAKGFVRPVRTRYKHVGIRPSNPTRPLTEEEQARHAGCNYVCYEPYPPSEDTCVVGRYWTQRQLSSGCGVVTSMGLALCETYARSPDFYGATFCVGCSEHYPVGEFVWDVDGTVVGS